METDRLVQCAVDPSRDVEGCAEAMADEESVRFIGSKTMKRAEDWRSMATVVGHWQICGAMSWSTSDRMMQPAEFKKGCTGPARRNQSPWCDDG